MDFQSMLSKLKRDATQSQNQSLTSQPSEKKQRTSNGEFSASGNEGNKETSHLHHNHLFPTRKVSTVYLACPPNVQTGGPEAMHQLCHKINSLSDANANINITAYMLFVKEHPSNGVQHVSNANSLHAYDSIYSKLRVATSFPVFEYDTGDGDKDNNGKNNNGNTIYNDSLIIWPECWTHLIDSFQPENQQDHEYQYDKTNQSLKRYQTAIWWLSVNNNNSKFKNWERNDILHLYQSEYAKCYLTENLKKVKRSIETTKDDSKDSRGDSGMGSNRKLNNNTDVSSTTSKSKGKLSDEVHNMIVPMMEFIPSNRHNSNDDNGNENENSNDNDNDNIHKTDTSSKPKFDQARTLEIVYNPFKGVHYTDSIIRRSGSKFTFTPIGSIEKRISPADVTKLLQQAKIYIDFGPHPGMDRLPREAALAGCIVITNMEGAAFYEEDVPILKEYKVNNFNVDSIHRLLTSCIDKYDEKVKDFESYRVWIHGQESRMDDCVNTLLSKINTNRHAE